MGWEWKTQVDISAPARDGLSMWTLVWKGSSLAKPKTGTHTNPPSLYRSLPIIPLAGLDKDIHLRLGVRWKVWEVLGG